MSGGEGELWKANDALATMYIVKMRRLLGPRKSDAKEVVVLNRVLTWDGDEVRYEAYPRHAEVMFRDLGLDEAKHAATPGANVGKGDIVDETLIDRARHRIYRSAVARANFLAQDRPHIRYTVKELCRRMSAPREHGEMVFKRLGRYLKRKP